MCSYEQTRKSIMARLLMLRPGSEPTVCKQVLPDLNVVKFPTNAQPAVLRALLNGTIDVAVERPETIQYYNSKV